MKVIASYILTLGIIATVSSSAFDIQTTPADAASVKLKRCGTNWNCLIQAAKTCTPAQVRGVTHGQMLGMDYANTGVHEIWGKKNNYCVLYSKFEKSQVKLSDALKRQALSRGVSPQEIAAYEQLFQANASQYQTSNLCRFPQSSNLVQYLQIVQRPKQTSIEFRMESLSVASSRSVLIIGGRDIGVCESKSLI